MSEPVIENQSQPEEVADFRNFKTQAPQAQQAEAAAQPLPEPKKKIYAVVIVLVFLALLALLVYKFLNPGAFSKLPALPGNPNLPANFENQQNRQ